MLWVAVLLLGCSVLPQAPAQDVYRQALVGGDVEGTSAQLEQQDGVRALHREYDKNWRHRVGSAAAEPSADEEDVAEGDAGAGEQPAAPAEDSAFEDSLQPKRRRYNRKRPRPEQGPEQGGEDDGQGPKRRKLTRPVDEVDQDAEDYRRRKPIQRRRRPLDAGAEDSEDKRTPSSTTENVATPVDLKSLLKQTAGQLSLSELLQNRNLSLADLLKGNRGALSALTASPSTQPPLAHAEGPAKTTSNATPTSSTSDAADREQERPNAFVPSKPRRLPPVQRPSTSTTTTQEPEITTSRPRRLPAVVARVKAAEEQRERERDALDPMSPAMMAMITLEAADPHTSKPRRIPALAPTPSPITTTTTSTTTTTPAPNKLSTPIATPPPREFYPLNLDSLEITTPRLMGVPRPKDKGPPPVDRIIDAQVFSPGAIPSKFKPHGFVLPTSTEHEPASSEAPAASSAPITPAPATLQNTSDHFRLENETLDMKEGNALDKRKIASPRPFVRSGAEQAPTSNATATSTPLNVNELDKDKEREKLDKRKQLVGSGPRRLPPTLAGTRRLPAVNRLKSTTEAPREAPRETTAQQQEHPDRAQHPQLPGRLPGLAGLIKRPSKDTPPTRFALPLPEVISVEKMIADAKNRGALESEEPSTTTPSTTTVFTSRDEILDLLKSEQSSARLSRILAERNMTLEDLLQHRERGSSQLHFADFFRNATVDADKPVDLVPKEIAPAERKESVNILRSFHEVPKYPFAYGSADDSEEAASTLSVVNIKPAGIVLPADPGEGEERYHQPPNAGPAAPSRAPRVIPSQPHAQPPQPYPIPTYRLPEPPASANNPYLVIKHVSAAAPTSYPSYPPPRAVPDTVILEHVGEIRQIGSSNVEDAIVVDSDPGGRMMLATLPPGVKSAIIASTVICGLAIVGFLTVFIVFRWRQKRALIRARGAILCEQLQRGSFRGRSLSPVLVNVSKSGLSGMSGQPMPYYSKKDLSSRATSNTASNRHYYLWRSLRKTFQEDDME